MSFRELRNFTEIMRSLGYPRPISMDNFRTPNFELVADILVWLVRKYDPTSQISEEIDTETDRVLFLTSIATIMMNKARIKLNTKKIYASDGHAVKEMLKIAKLLYDASRIDPSSIDEDDDFSSSSLGSRYKDSKETRNLTSEIINRGAKLFDLLEYEPEIRDARQKAMRFLETVSSNLESTAENEFLDRSIHQLINNVRDNIESLEKQYNELEAENITLTGKMQKKKTDLERNEKRLKSLQSVRPAFMDEYERLEIELEKQYQIYCERFRNLDYLEHELDLYNQNEREKLKERERSMKRMQKKLRDEELRILRGEQDDDLASTELPDRSNNKPYDNDNNNNISRTSSSRGSKEPSSYGMESRESSANSDRKSKSSKIPDGNTVKRNSNVTGKIDASDSEESLTASEESSSASVLESDDGQLSVGESAESELMDDVEDENTELGSEQTHSGSESEGSTESDSDQDF